MPFFIDVFHGFYRTAIVPTFIDIVPFLINIVPTNNLFLFFRWPFLEGFFYELFLNKGRRESMAPKLPNMCVFGRKKQLFRQRKTKKSFFFKKISTILDIEDSILETFWYCDNVRDLGFREYRRRYSLVLTLITLEIEVSTQRARPIFVFFFQSFLLAIHIE